jgi:hypothetical protein
MKTMELLKQTACFDAAHLRSEAGKNIRLGLKDPAIFTHTHERRIRVNRLGNNEGGNRL